MSSRVVRDGSSAVISGAWAWWPITPCMNRVGGVGPDPDDVNGCVAMVTRVASPGAPGCTRGGAPH